MLINSIFSLGALAACGNIAFYVYYVFFERAGESTSPELAAHMFVFYYAVISTITLAAYAAAGIAGTAPLKTAITGFRVGIAKFVVPFYIIYKPDFILVGADPFKAVVAIVIFVVGIWPLPGVHADLCSDSLNPWNGLFCLPAFP